MPRSRIGIDVWFCSEGCRATTNSHDLPGHDTATPALPPRTQQQASTTPRARQGICPVCRVRTRAISNPLACSHCGLAYHYKCARMGTVDRARWNESGQWACPHCCGHGDQAVGAPAGESAQSRGDFIPRDALTILQWNADGLKSSIADLQALVSDRQIDICLIQETKLSPRDATPRLPGYVAERRDRPPSATSTTRHAGGLVTYIREGIPFSKAQAYKPGFPSTELEALAIRVRTQRDEWLTVTNVYSPPERSRAGEFNPVVLCSSSSHLLAGDWNCHSSLWDLDQPEDADGNRMEDWMIEENLGCLNDGTPTRLNRATGGLSAPDVTVMHNSWLPATDWQVLELQGSDHHPILTRLCLNWEALSEGQSPLKWNWRQANWPEFTNAVDTAVSMIPLGEEHSLSVLVASFTEAIVQAARQHVGMVRQARRSGNSLSPDIREAIRTRNSLARTIGSNREEWKAACVRVRELVIETKQRRWREFVDSLQEEPSSTRAWNTIQSLSDKAPPLKERCRTLISDGRAYVTDKKKADLFARKYAAVSRHRFNRIERQKISAVRRRMTLASRAAGPTAPNCSDYSMTELKMAIERMKPRGAEGPDQVAPRFIQHLGPAALEFFLSCCNRSWHEGFLPQEWRTATIVPLLKSGKPASEVESFRPISLTSCLGKVMERLVCNRLYHIAESWGLLTEDQAGFRAMRSTEDQILRVTQTISDGFQAKPALRSVMALLDFSKAYDTVWRADLMDALLEAGIPFCYLRWIQGFLTNRLGRVRINAALSKPYLFREGLPQGSVLSPLLFLFVANSVRANIRSSLASIFADDVGLLTQHTCIRQATSMLQADIQRVMEWSREHKLSLNLRKCEVTFFSSDPGEARYVPQISVEGVEIRFNPTPTFLGVVYDRTLSFRPQVDKVAAKVKSCNRILGALGAKDWGWEPSLMKRVYQAVGLSTIRYCGPGWQPWLAKTNIETLERAQNQCLRTITGMCAGAPVEALRLETGCQSVATVIKQDALVAMEKSLRLTVSNPRRSVMTRQVHHRTQRPSHSLRSLAQELEGELHMPTRRLQFPDVTVAPWTHALEAWPISLTLRGGATRSSPEDVKRADAMATIDAYEGMEFILYTDGSAVGGTRDGGCACVVTRGTAAQPQIVAVVTNCGGVHTSSFDEEVRALSVAVGWLSEHGRGGNYLVCSDSRSALSALGSLTVSRTSYIAAVRRKLLDVHGSVSFQWIPGHCGLPGNDEADRHAKTAFAGLSAQDRLRVGPKESYTAAKAYIRRALTDPPPQHARTREVYGAGLPKSAHLPSRKENVVLAQLRSGHSRVLQAYMHRIGVAPTPMCPRCYEAEEDLKHFMQECPATLALRIQVFGVARPALSVLSRETGTVASYLRRLRLL